jgi:proteic killer suppression protein
MSAVYRASERKVNVSTPLALILSSGGSKVIHAVQRRACRTRAVSSIPSTTTLHYVTIWVTVFPVIRGFRHKGLAKFFETGSKSGIQAQHATRLRLTLGRLSAATAPHDMALPGLTLHPLKGSQAGRWAVSVSGNWRVTFWFEGKDADAVDYEDYH